MTRRPTQRRVIISGRVQGVGFRAATVRVALDQENLTGWVRNLSDGNVEAVFAGPEDQVLAMVAWCKRGPSSAEVRSLEVKEEPFDPRLGPFRIA